MTLEEFWNPRSKRIKISENPDNISSPKDSEPESISHEKVTFASISKPSEEIIEPSDNRRISDKPIPSSQTELETSLAPVETGSEAIDEYEASGVSEGAEKTSPQHHYGEKQWSKGRSSIYVDAFNLALDSVLKDEAHLFDDAEQSLFDQWKGLSYQSQYLYVRLFLRKTSAWHRINRLGYYDDIADLPAAVADLRKRRSLPVPSSLLQTAPDSMEPPENTVLSDSFQFAEGIEEISSLEEASSLLLLDELKTLAKDAKVQGKNKRELLKAFRETSSTQSGLNWFCPQPTGDEVSDLASSPSANSSRSQDVGRDGHFTQRILDYTGDCIRLSDAPRKLFERVHLVFYRSTEWSEKSLTTIILAKISRRNYPNYVVSRSGAIFPSRSALLEFENALRVQFELDNAMESSSVSAMENLQSIKQLSESVYPRWKTLLQEEQRKEERVYETGERAYLRRFSPAWVYTRIIHKGLYALGRFKEHKREHEILTELLDQRLFHAARRGAWYQRKALLEEHYMWFLTPFEGRSEEAQKRDWKRKALRTCEGGLQDPNCHLIYHYDLQKRITKLEKSLKVVKREQHDFGHVMLAKPEERIVEGIRIEQNTPVDKTNGDAKSRRGVPTMWVDEREDGICRVENMCLSWYRDNGWKGYHAEGGIVRTLFGFLFCDVLFTYVPNVFQTEFQTCPLDLHTDSFYPSRASEINHRLVQIANGEAEQLIRQVHQNESENQACIVGVDWSFELDDLAEIAQCFRGEALASICKVMAQEYQQRGGGIPDLFLWSVERKEVMFVEVKSENDRLSDTQRLWIHVLTGAGVRVELCNAVAREVRIMS